MQILHTRYISYGTYKENLSNNQEIFEFAIISFILVTLLFDSKAILLGNIGWLILSDCYGDKILLMIDNDHKQCNLHF